MAIVLFTVTIILHHGRNQKYAKDSQEKADILRALDVPINPTVTNDKTGGRWGGPTETRFDKVWHAGWYTTVSAECFSH